MSQIKFNQSPGTCGRGWDSECGIWTIAMFGMGRYHLFHNKPTRTQVGEYKTLGEAKDWAEKINTILPR